MDLRKLTLAALLVALGTMAATVVVMPFAGARLFPLQHAINVVAAVMLGPWYGVLMAFSVSLLRNLLGTGSLLAFPGSMIGVLVAAVVYQRTKCTLKAVIGEVLGTGILGALVAFPVARFVLGRDVAALVFVTPFFLSSLLGGLIAYALISTLKGNVLKKLGLSEQT